MKLLYVTIAMFALAGTLLSTELVGSYTFEAKFEEVVQAATVAESPEVAKKHLDQAIAYLEEKKLTEGSMAYLWDSPSDDVGLWYGRLKGIQAELDAFVGSQSAISYSTQQMTAWDAQVLRRVKSTLLKPGSSEYVRHPGRVWTLHNKGAGLATLWGGILSMIAFIVMAIVWVVKRTS